MSHILGAPKMAYCITPAGGHRQLVGYAAGGARLAGLARQAAGEAVGDAEVSRQADETVGDGLFRFQHLYRLVVSVAASALAAVQYEAAVVGGPRDVEGRRDGTAPVYDPYGRGEDGQAVEEVGGAVQGVQHPQGYRGPVPRIPGSSLVPSSPRMPWPGKRRAIPAARYAWVDLSAAVTGSRCLSSLNSTSMRLPKWLDRISPAPRASSMAWCSISRISASVEGAHDFTLTLPLSRKREGHVAVGRPARYTAGITLGQGGIAGRSRVFSCPNPGITSLPANLHHLRAGGVGEHIGGGTGGR